jgi:3-oxoacyl-[acyl-carrier-protein] synthase-1
MNNNGHELIAASGVSCLGLGLNEHFSKVFVNSVSGLEKSSEFLLQGETYVGKYKGDLPKLPEKIKHLNSRFAGLLTLLYEDLKIEIDKVTKTFGKDRVGIILGSSTSGILETELAFKEKKEKGSYPEDYYFFQQEIGAGSEILSFLTGANGPSYTISTACSSSAKAFNSAKALLDLKVCDAVIVGGVDALCNMTLRGFQSLEVLSPTLTNPFSANRRGLNIGEGGALFIMTRGTEGVRFLGGGESSDAYHISSPQPDGEGAIRAISEAILKANISPNNIKYVNLHGTGTGLNDSMEAKAIGSLRLSDTKASSTKPFTGHLLGAAGAIEALFCFLTLNQSGVEKIIPAHLWDNESDLNIPELNFVKISDKMQFHKGDAILSTSFAFGGSNACLCFGV